MFSRKGDREMNFKCACCRKDINDDEASYVYQGMAVSQYICPECQKLPFIDVWERLSEEDSPSYIGDRLMEEVLG